MLVYGEGLYSDVWIDSHHKHDSNQVVTSIMHVIDDVRTRRGGKLLLVLRIQADNCRRENKTSTCLLFVLYLLNSSILLRYT